MADSFQNEVPKARINLKLDLHTGGASKKMELPLKLLVAGDFSNGQESAQISEREKVNITKNNFDSVLSEYSPKLNLTVKNTLSEDGGEDSIQLTFQSMKDFTPEQVAAQISDGPVAPLPNAATRANKVLTCDASGNFQFIVPSSGSAADVLNELAESTGSSLVGTQSGKTVQQFIDVTGNIVGTNNYATLPAVGSTITSGSDYLYNGVLYTTVGESGVIQSITGNAVLTDNGNAYLLDKRWPINDARAWGVKSGIDSTQAFQTAGTFLVRNLPEVTSLYVPPIQLHISQVELRDVSNFNIHFDGTYILGTATTSKSSVIKVVNALQFTTSGSFIIEAVNASNYTYSIELTAGLPSLIAPLTGLMTQVHVASPRFRNFPCAVRVGDGSDLQISEISITDILSNSCNCIIEANGSQVIVNTSGNLMVEPQSGFTYPAGCAHCIGGVVYHNGGELVTSVGGAESAIALIKQSSSSLYGNPFGSFKATGAHVESGGYLMFVSNSTGISGSSDSKYSCVSFSNCQGSMLNGSQVLAGITVNDYEGSLVIDDTCNFYTSTTRTSRIVYSLSDKFKFNVGHGSFGKGFSTLSAEIGSGNVDWKHDLQPIMKMSVNTVTIPSSGQAPLGFSSRESTGDYAFYYPDTSSGGIVLTHQLSCMVISISVPATGLLTVVVKIDGVEYFSCQGSGSVTFTREMMPVGSTITFTAINGTGSSVTTASSARVIVSGANLK